MSARTWVYNYNFEFEFSNQPSVRFGSRQPFPWWFLNRCPNLFLPLTASQDFILCYQRPDDHLLERLTAIHCDLPLFVTIQPETGESNAILRDLASCSEVLSDLSETDLMPWGWSPAAVVMATRKFSNTLPSDCSAIVATANSKQFSDQLRNNCLPESFRIPSLQINEPNISLTCLENKISGFISCYSHAKIKHYFGASGRLADTMKDLPISVKWLSKWKSWIDHSGGILVEQLLSVKAEYSIQAEITDNGQLSVIALVRLFSGLNGSYLGNLVDQSSQSMLAPLTQQLQPLFSRIIDLGYRGPLGFDLIQTPDDQFKLIEINARLTMGRMAFEWHKAANSHIYGLFLNCFFKNSACNGIKDFLQFCSTLEKEFGCSLTPINFVLSKIDRNSLVTILIGANTKNELLRIVSLFNPSLLQNIKL